MKPEQIKRLYTEFGAEIAFSSVFASSFRASSAWKHRCILRYLKEKYSGFIAEYKQKQTKTNGTVLETNATASDTNSPAAETPAPIWTMWWQGADNLPELVKMCHASINRHRGNHPFKIITCDNYQEYVNIPGYVLDKVEAGAITITHLSDIIRFALLSQYGGLWLDSTIFVADRIPEEIFTAEYFTVKWPMRPKKGNLVQGRWTNFLHAAQKGNLLCRFIFDFFLEYWRTQNSLINYFLIDYAIQMAWDEIPRCRKLLEAVPVTNDDLYRLEKMLNAKWDPAVFEEIKKNALFSKLSWRKEGNKKTASGEETVYGHLVNLHK